MKWRGIILVGSFSVIFFFIPSLAIKIWDYLINAPWQAKSWLFYLFLAVIFFGWVRWRIARKKANQIHPELERPLLFIAKQRLAKGEISLEEFREIRREIE